MRCPSIRRGLGSASIGWRKDVQNVSKTKNKKDRWVRQVRTGFWHDRQCKFHFGGNVRNCTAIHRSANRGAALMVKKGRKQDGRLLVLASGCKITFRINGAPLWHLCDFAICSIKHGGKAEKGASRLDGKIYRSLSLSFHLQFCTRQRRDINLAFCLYKRSGGQEMKWRSWWTKKGSCPFRG